MNSAQSEQDREEYRFALVVRLDEDLHTGSGSADAAADALLYRDRRGLPAIRATHFRGLLREAGREFVSPRASSPPIVRRRCLPGVGRDRDGSFS